MEQKGSFGHTPYFLVQSQLIMTAQDKRLKPQTINPVFTDADLGRYNSVSKLIWFHFTDFFDWWYIRMPIIYLLQIQRLSMVLNDKLSISILFKTFFTPWHRDRKIVGYFMGITMRILYLPIAITVYLTIMILYFLLIIAWILLPMITLIFIVITPIL